MDKGLIGVILEIRCQLWDINGGGGEGGDWQGNQEWLQEELLEPVADLWRSIPLCRGRVWSGPGQSGWHYILAGCICACKGRGSRHRVDYCWNCSRGQTGWGVPGVGSSQYSGQSYYRFGSQNLEGPQRCLDILGCPVPPSWGRHCGRHATKIQHHRHTTPFWETSSLASLNNCW